MGEVHQGHSASCSALTHLVEQISEQGRLRQARGCHRLLTATHLIYKLECM